MKIHRQPPGSGLCSWYTVLNAFEKAGLPAPTYEELREKNPPPTWWDEQRPGETYTLGKHEQASLLSKYGWTTACMYVYHPCDPLRVVRPFVEAGAVVLIGHNQWGPHKWHSVVVDTVDDDGITTLDSATGDRHRVPWRMCGMKPDELGLSWEFAVAWPPNTANAAD